jgi:hypothetical protein
MSLPHKQSVLLRHRVRLKVCSEASDIDFVGGHGILDGPRHRAEGSLVEDDLRAFGCTAAVAGVADVAGDQGEAGVIFKIFDIIYTPGGKVVETDHLVAMRQEIFTQVRSDESCSTCY